MIADLGTRRGATITDVNQESNWNLGFAWMSQHSSSFPIKTYAEVKLDVNQTVDSKAELLNNQDLS